MATPVHSESARAVLLAAARTSPVASRMAMRFTEMGCRVAAVYPSKAHPLASTKAVQGRYHYGAIDPVGSLLTAIAESGAEVVVPCDGMAVRHLHALFASLPTSPEGTAFAKVIERSLGDPAGYLLVDSRHEIQVAARAEGLNAVESFAIGKATDPETIAQTLPFPWIVKTDYSWGESGRRTVHNLKEAREFIRRAGRSPSLGMVAKQLVVNGDRAALEEWLHAKQPGLSAQPPLTGKQANTVTACWKGTVLAQISMEAMATDGENGPSTTVRILENEEMVRTVRRMADRLGLNGFHCFDFVITAESGRAWLTEFNAHCAEATHLNAGAGHDPIGAFCRKWLGSVPEGISTPHPGPVVAYFPNAWAANPDDPILNTGSFDIPAGEPEFVEHVRRLIRSGRKFERFQSGISSPFQGKRG